ncbi:MAG TPA: hypothetical protein VI583_14720 [Cyclobacteriaceae bacterium]|nr:hypothetical protein [Cyclobacteriaceae bacterium]
MAKLKYIVKQLSVDEFEAIYHSLLDTNAEKSAMLLKLMRDKHLSDAKIMEELEVNANAYYTLRSRLNQRIEEYLLQQMENPRADILKKVANINEIIFTKKKAIAIATLKKLEKELLDYDLSNELITVYKLLKKFHIHAADYFNYSQSYNRHVAYTLAVDKAEDLLADYFKKYGHYSLLGEYERSDLELTLLNREINNVCSLYESHRLFVYQSLINIFHRLFVNKDDNLEMQLEPIEDIIDKVENVIHLYQLDSLYYHLQTVFEFLKLEYYNHYRVYRKAEEYYGSVNESIATLLTNYSLFTFPSQFLITKILRHIRMETQDQMQAEDDALFNGFESDVNDIPNHLIYVSYRALSCYYAKKYDEASKWLNQLLNEVSFKRYPYAQLEIKILLAFIYCLNEEFELFQQLMNSIQRQIRLIGKKNCEHLFLYSKILKISVSNSQKNKYTKIKSLAEKINQFKFIPFAPTLLIHFDDKLISRLTSI